MDCDRLKKLRQKKGYTQIKIQLLTGIDQSDYSKIEKGIRYPTVEQAKRLALVFETSTDYIFCLTDEETPYPRRS
ncbi:MAG: helix-turn-helix domain-containing protein [Clostridiales Family XIII bacterium]|jgi:transcriptional regulator with XRE-family HTH domain|nr:helix-turn-helix domain-containing protein [Clostridiales Family XIII bacterium]